MSFVFLVIIIGGLIKPILGLLVLAMMLFFLSLAFFKGRFWCGWLCPRGAFLEIFLAKISRHKKIPQLFYLAKSRWTLFGVLISFMLLMLAKAGTQPENIGLVFITMCVVTTIIALPLALLYQPRTWCLICPMGTLQGVIGKNRQTIEYSSACNSCGVCFEKCPVGLGIEAMQSAAQNQLCLRCGDCKENCPQQAVTLK